MADHESNRFTMRAYSREGNADGKPRKFTLEASWGGLITLAMAFALCLVWVFIFGVLVGRGHKPERSGPEITKVLPGSGDKPVEIHEPQPLKPEDLKFHEALTQDNPAGEQAKAQPEKPAEKPVERSAEKPVEKETAKQAKQETPKAPPPAAAPAVKQAPPPPPAPLPVANAPGADPRFRFVFQAASYNRREVAETTRQQIAAQGLSASLETADVRGTTWYRVLVTLDGTEKDAGTAMDRLAKAGVPKPLLRSKKAL